MIARLPPPPGMLPPHQRRNCYLVFDRVVGKYSGNTWVLTPTSIHWRAATATQRMVKFIFDGVVSGGGGQLPPPFPPELILTQLSALELKRAGSLLFQILLLWFDIFSSSVGQGHYFTSTHYFCICSTLLKSTRLWIICSMKWTFLMKCPLLHSLRSLFILPF